MAWPNLPKIIVWITIMAASSNSLAQSTGKMNISVTGLRSATGKLAISVFSVDNSKGFPGNADKATETFYLDLNSATEQRVTTKSLPHGEYAIALMHDEDGDGKFGTTLFGIPKEGFGFSNNPRILFGAPSFRECSIRLAQDLIEVPIKAKYFL